MNNKIYTIESVTNLKTGEPTSPHVIGTKRRIGSELHEGSFMWLFYADDETKVRRTSLVTKITVRDDLVIVETLNGKYVLKECTE